MARRPYAAIIDLIEVLPAGNAQRAADHGESVFMGKQRRTLESHFKTHRTADASLRFMLHSFGTGKPVVGVIIPIDERDIMFLRKTNILLLSELILFKGMDVRVVKIDGVIDPGKDQRLH